MLGDTYNFSTFFDQEILFDISAYINITYMEEEELGKFYEEKQSLMETKLSQERRQHSRANSHRGTEHSNRVMTYQQFREYNTERPELKTNPFFGGRDNNSTRMNNTIQSTVKSNKKVNVFRKTNSAVNIHSKKQPIRNMNKKSMHSNSSIDTMTQ